MSIELQPQPGLARQPGPALERLSPAEEDLRAAVTGRVCPVVSEADRVRVRSAFGAGPDAELTALVASWYTPPAWVQGYIDFEDAVFLADAVTSLRPWRVIEIGTASGFSTAILLRALAHLGVAPADGPALHTFDISPFCYFDPARPVGSAVEAMCPELAPNVRIHAKADARDAAKLFAQSPVTLAFIDGDHRHPWPILDLVRLWPALAPGAWVILHDVNLPAIAAWREGLEGRPLDWHHTGPSRLLKGWPFERVRFLTGWTNIAAVRVPDDKPDLATLKALLRGPILAAHECELKPAERAELE